MSRRRSRVSACRGDGRAQANAHRVLYPAVSSRDITLRMDLLWRTSDEAVFAQDFYTDERRLLGSSTRPPVVRQAACCLVELAVGR